MQKWCSFSEIFFSKTVLTECYRHYVCNVREIFLGAYICWGGVALCSMWGSHKMSGNYAVLTFCNFVETVWKIKLLNCTFIYYKQICLLMLFEKSITRHPNLHFRCVFFYLSHSVLCYTGLRYMLSYFRCLEIHATPKAS